MTLVGQSLGDLRKACSGSKFSSGTALRAGIQCLEAIEDMHGIGFLHRDIKPGNFAIGREEAGEQRIIYILDFGLARKFIKDTTKQLRTPRATAGFRGTKYLLNGVPKDDLETWFYQQIEITKGKLPWAAMADKGSFVIKQVKVGECKTESRKNGDLVKDTPRQYALMIQYIDGLKYWDTPDYEYLYKLLRQGLEERRITDELPYDWEKGGEHKAHSHKISSLVHKQSGTKA